MDSPRLNYPTLGQLIQDSNQPDSPEPEEVISPVSTQPNPQSKPCSVRKLFQTTADPRPLSPDPRPLSPPLNIPTTHNPLPPSQTQPTLSSTPRRTSNCQPVTQPKNKKGKGKGPATPTQTLRRSARINGRSPQTEFYKRRVNTLKGESSAGLRKLVQQAIQEAKVIEALKEDNLKSVPLQEDQISAIEAYCGINGPHIPLNPEAAAPPQHMHVDDTHLYEESVMAAFESEPEELSEDEAESV
ncbi:hypothetical protein FCM35_KLT10596 [Carex littledalei]|uniref:Uncharacterized protein n=1 Tax=Carex littledalei TaxID=544730 RepID=A0A833QF40_9POAL|nr:hypothetical protein FCM35_KLT10596 [Carex littledalei]